MSKKFKQNGQSGVCAGEPGRHAQQRKMPARERGEEEGGWEDERTYGTFMSSEGEGGRNGKVVVGR